MTVRGAELDERSHCVSDVRCVRAFHSQKEPVRLMWRWKHSPVCIMTLGGAGYDYNLSINRANQPSPVRLSVGVCMYAVINTAGRQKQNVFTRAGRERKKSIV